MTHTESPGTTVEADAALERARNSFAAVFGNGRLSLDQLRHNLDAMMLESDLAEDVSVDAIVVSGVEALRVVAGSAVDDNVLVWFHGGGYVMGSPHGYRHAAAALSRALGSVVVLPDYRLAPEHPFPAALEDAAAVVDALIAEYGSERTIVGGDSAGGGLTVSVLVDIRNRGATLPAAAVAVSPLADFTASGASVTTNRDIDLVITERSIGMLAAAYLRGHDRDHPLASPVFADLTGLPPILLLASDSEILLDDAVRIHNSVRVAGGVSTLSVYPNTCHAWTLFTEFLPQARNGVDEIARFAGKVLP
ncbi:MAG: alpha/beta hydrolase [Rhodococcus sp. (in: high G+C Gram-positive bacteria)]|uniref:alpha/beta hydrolase n=1 Tax=Rhodococcus sp. TaxID=1831 RepID=UPI003BB0FCF1